MIEVADVFVDAVVERLLFFAHHNAFGLRLAHRDGGIHDTAALVFAQQGARVAISVTAEGRVAAHQFKDEVVIGLPDFANQCFALAAFFGEFEQGLPFDRAEAGAGFFDKVRVEFAAAGQVVAQHVQNKFPLDVVETGADLAEKFQVGVFVCAPAATHAKHREQIPNFERMNLHGGGGHQQQTGDFVALVQVFEQAEQVVGAVDFLLEVFAASMMGFINDQQVPGAGGQDLFAAVAALGELAACEEQVEGIPGIIAFLGQCLIVVVEEFAAIVTRHIQGKFFVEFFLPLLKHRLGRENQGTFDPPGEPQLADDQPGFDGFAQANFVAQHGAFRETLHDGIGDPRLVRPGHDGRGARAQFDCAGEIGRIAQELEDDPFLRAGLALKRGNGFANLRLGDALERVADGRGIGAEGQQAVFDGLGDVDGNPVRLLVIPKAFKIDFVLFQVGRSFVPGKIDREIFVIIAPGGFGFVDAARKADLAAFGVGKNAQFGMVVIAGLRGGQGQAARVARQDDFDFERAFGDHPGQGLQTLVEQGVLRVRKAFEQAFGDARFQVVTLLNGLDIPFG